MSADNAALDTFAALIEPAKLNLAKTLSLPFFVGCEFDSDEWTLKEDKNKSTEYVLKLANEPVAEGGRRLRDYPGLLQTVKIYLVIAWSVRSKAGKCSNPIGLYKRYNNVINLIRYLLYKFKIENLSSINKAVADELLDAYLHKTLEERLDLSKRAIGALGAIKKSNLEKFTVPNGHAKTPDFNHTLFCAELGLNPRALQPLGDYQNELAMFKSKHGFRQQSRKNGANRSSGDDRTEAAIRKPLTAIQHLFSVLHIMADLFPEEHRVQSSWLSDVNVAPEAKRRAPKVLRKTRDIPRVVFYPLMDQAIRWVLDADELFGYYEQAKVHYQSLLDKSSRIRAKKASEKDRAHYAAKQMTEWFKENQPGAFPFPVSGFAKNTHGKSTAVDPKKVAEVKRLLAQDGVKHRDVAKEMGVHKSTVSRWLNWTPPIAGESLDAIINKHLASACLLVLFAFSGRRHAEIVGLKSDCIVERGGLYFLRVHQQKTKEGMRDLPTTKLVAKAVSVLNKISEQARTSSGSDRLVIATNVYGKEQQVWHDFNDFCTYVGIKCEDSDGERYSFADHQFRRFWAMTYWYKYPDPDLPSLSWFLGHESVDMTMEYITDADGQWAMKSVKNERIIDLMEEELKPNTSVVGNEISALLGSLEGQPALRADQMAMKGDLVDKYVLNFVRDGACFGASPELIARSKCVEDGAIQVSSACVGSCDGCPNLVPVDKPFVQLDRSDIQAHCSSILLAKRGEQHV